MERRRTSSEPLVDADEVPTAPAEWLLRLIDQIELPAVVFDREFSIVAANPAFRRLARPDATEDDAILGTSFLDTLQTSSRSAVERLAHLPPGAREPVQVWHPSPGGEPAPMEYDFLALFGEPPLIGGLARDRSTDLMLIEQLAHLYQELEERHRDLKRLHRKLERLADTDELTGLANRRSFETTFEREWARFQRTGDPMSLILVDADHFKKVNDEHGHVRGDLVLQGIAQVLASGVRAMDVCARYGGEEFAIVLPKTPGEHAYAIAQRLREAVAEMTFPVGGESFHVTVSAGIATTSDALKDKDRVVLFVAADAALRRAKKLGRNRVESSRLRA